MASMRRACFLESKRLRALLKPASPISLQSFLSENSLFIAAAIAMSFAGGTKKPVTPSCNTSGIPPTLVATTGFFIAIASIIVLPKTSCQMEGTTMTSAAAITRGTSSLVPVNINLSFPKPSSRDISFNIWTHPSIVFSSQLNVPFNPNKLSYLANLSFGSLSLGGRTKHRQVSLKQVPHTPGYLKAINDAGGLVSPELYSAIVEYLERTYEDKEC